MGSKYYTSIEILNKQPYDKKIDVWSATIIVYILCCRQLPYPGSDFNEVRRAVKSINLHDHLEQFIDISEDAKDFIEKGLN